MFKALWSGLTASKSGVMHGPTQVVLVGRQRLSYPQCWLWLSALLGGKKKKGMLIERIIINISDGLDVEVGWLKAWIRLRVTPDSCWSEKKLNLRVHFYLFKVVPLMCSVRSQIGSSFFSKAPKRVFHFNMHSGRYFLFPLQKYPLRFLCSFRALLWGEVTMRKTRVWGFSAGAPLVHAVVQFTQSCSRHQYSENVFLARTSCLYGEVKAPHILMPACSNLIVKSRQTKPNIYFSHVWASCSVIQQQVLPPKHTNNIVVHRMKCYQKSDLIPLKIRYCSPQSCPRCFPLIFSILVKI